MSNEPLDYGRQPPKDNRALFPVVAVMAIVWHYYCIQIIGHEDPRFSLPKKVALSVGAAIILICLVLTGTIAVRLGCAFLFFFVTAFIVGAIWLR